MTSRSRGESFTETEALQNGYGSNDLVFFRSLVSDFPEYRFRMGSKFAFHPPKTVIIGPSEPSHELLALHEVSHAICKHKDFKMDIGRLKMEVQAWEKARELATIYGIYFDEDLVQDELDTYRNWLHQKSRCPKCGLTRFETPDRVYHCPRCENFT